MDRQVVQREAPAAPAPVRPAGGVAFAVLFGASFSHLLNDLIQSSHPLSPALEGFRFRLSFTQVGLITLTSQLTASLLQPLVGI